MQMTREETMIYRLAVYKTLLKDFQVRIERWRDTDKGEPFNYYPLINGIDEDIAEVLSSNGTDAI